MRDWFLAVVVVGMFVGWVTLAVTFAGWIGGLGIVVAGALAGYVAWRVLLAGVRRDDG